MNRLLEFINNDELYKSIISEIKMLIFYDEKWMFPFIGFDIMEKSLEIKISSDVKVLVEQIVNEMNLRVVDPENWEDDFYKILTKFI